MPRRCFRCGVFQWDAHSILSRFCLHPPFRHLPLDLWTVIKIVPIETRSVICSCIFLHFLLFYIIFLYEDSKGLKGMTDLGLMFPAPAVVKQDHLSPRLSESSDASTSDSSQSGFQVSHTQMFCLSTLMLTVFFSGFWKNRWCSTAAGDVSNHFTGGGHTLLVALK